MFNQETHGDVTGLKLETMRLSSPQLGKMTVLDQRVWRDRYTADIEQKWGSLLYQNKCVCVRQGPIFTFSHT